MCEPVCFLLSEVLLLRGSHEMIQCILRYVPDPVCGTHKVIAGEHASVLFNHRHLTAGPAHPAQVGFPATEHQRHFTEKLDFRPVQVMKQPLREHIAEERTVLLCCDRVRGQLTFMIAADDGNELHPACIQVAQCLIDRKRILRRGGSDCAQQVRLDPVRLKQTDAIDDTCIRFFTIRSGTVSIMDRLGPVQTDTDVKVLLTEKCTPCFVQVQSVGLQAVPAFPAIGQVFLLQGYGLLIEFKACQHRLTAVPGEGNHRARNTGKIIADARFQCVFRHPAPGRAARGVQVIAIGTTHAAGRACRLEHQNKRSALCRHVFPSVIHVFRYRSKKARVRFHESMAAS